MADPLLSPSPPVLMLSSVVVVTIIMAPVVVLTIIVSCALLAHPSGHLAGAQEALTQAQHVDTGGDQDRGYEATAHHRPNWNQIKITILSRLNSEQEKCKYSQRGVRIFKPPGRAENVGMRGMQERWKVESYLGREKQSPSPSGPFWVILASDWSAVFRYGLLIGSDRQCCSFVIDGSDLLCYRLKICKVTSWLRSESLLRKRLSWHNQCEFHGSILYYLSKKHLFRKTEPEARCHHASGSRRGNKFRNVRLVSVLYVMLSASCESFFISLLN